MKQAVAQNESPCFPNNVIFKTENYVNPSLISIEKYDVIMCLSVTKWVHLNFGDIGIKKLFDKVHQ